MRKNYAFVCKIFLLRKFYAYLCILLLFYDKCYPYFMFDHDYMSITSIKPSVIVSNLNSMIKMEVCHFHPMANQSQEAWMYS